MLTTFLIIGLIDFFGIVSTWQFELGGCPLYFEEPCDSNVVKFLLSSRKENATKLQLLNPFNPIFPEDFDPLTPLKIIIHGYGGLGIDSATRNVSDAYQDIGYNVIIVDWEPLASLPCYATAYFNTWHVGQCLAILVVSLIPLGIPPQIVHIVGFSLGAHIAGLGGHNLKNTLGQSVYRITGLDPALPFFATLKDEWKLDASDASFVDIIHTSAGIFGKLEATGHADFYVNGGTLQPFCYDAKHIPLCSHILAGLYFAESIRNPDAFVATKCNNIFTYYLGLCETGENAIMGEYIQYAVRGTYYVRTAEKPPFSLSTFFE